MFMGLASWLATWLATIRRLKKRESKNIIKKITWDNYKEVIRAFKRLLKGNIRLLKSFLKGILKLYKAIRGFTYHLRSYYSYPRPCAVFPQFFVFLFNTALVPPRPFQNLPEPNVHGRKPRNWNPLMYMTF